MEGDTLHMMSPYHERAPGRTPSKIIVPGNKSQSPSSENAEGCRAPRVLDHETQVVVPCELDGFLDIARRPSIDTNYGHVPLLAREPKGGVEVTTLDGPIGKGIGFVVGVFGCTRLIRTPDAVEPTSADIGAVSRGGVVARRGRWDRMDESLGDFGRQSLEFGVWWPTW